MRIGILSDTHGQARWMKHALTALYDRGARMIVHCGDVGSPDLLDLLIVRPDEHAAAIAFGNADDDLNALEQRVASLGITYLEDFGEIECNGKKIAVVHGDDVEYMQHLLQEQRYDYMFCGHTHCWRDEYFGRTRIINPGTAAWLTDRKPIQPATCALLHVASDRLEKITLS